MKKYEKVVGIIGHFGGNNRILDGQTIKTKVLYNELRTKTDWKIIKVDTYYRKKNLLRLLIDSFRCLALADDIIILLSRNGMRFFFPILYICSILFKKNIYHDVIGGSLDNYVNIYPNYKKYLNSFKVNWVETEGLKKKLEDKGINNCEVIPNFKRLAIQDNSDIYEGEIFKFCIFSRVMKEKGVEIAINSIKKINDAKGKLCELDIYGRVDEKYKEEFFSFLSEGDKNIRYKGEVDFDKTTDVLKDYYALLFPTYWSGEGFAGSIIDAFSSGIPVIASDWNCNGEVVKNGINGILYPNDIIKNLESAILWLIENIEAVNRMKKECIISAKEYQPDKYIEKIIREIEEC